MYARTEDMMDLLAAFSTRQWKFDNSNIVQLWSLLSEEDRQTFWFSLKDFDWKLYMKSFYHGIRKHILHEDLNNTTEALSKNRKYDSVYMNYFNYNHFYFFSFATPPNCLGKFNHLLMYYIIFYCF